MSTPYIGFGNDTLSKMPKVGDGDPIICPKCQSVHKLECGTKNGNKDDFLMFYRCGESSYLGAIAGRLVAGVTPDVSGKI